jgi:hypothetical protein
MSILHDQCRRPHDEVGDILYYYVTNMGMYLLDHTLTHLTLKPLVY